MNDILERVRTRLESGAGPARLAFGAGLQTMRTIERPYVGQMREAVAHVARSVR